MPATAADDRARCGGTLGKAGAGLHQTRAVGGVRLADEFTTDPSGLHESEVQPLTVMGHTAGTHRGASGAEPEQRGRSGLGQDLSWQNQQGPGFI
jgi:hypothetical protein